MTRRFLSLAFVIGCLLISDVAMAEPAISRPGEWPQWRGPKRDGLSRETGLNTNWDRTPPRLLWTAEGLGSGFAGVSIAGGRIFTTGNLEQGQAVIAIEPSTGAVLWSQTLTDDVPKHGYEGSRSTPTVDGERVYTVLSDGTLACVLARDGKLVWRRHFSKDFDGKMMSGWGFAESPLVDGDRLVCTPGGENAMIVALDKFSGEEIWRSTTEAFGRDDGINGKPLRDGAGYSSIVVSHGAGVKQYVQFVGRGVIGVRAHDGKFLWGYGNVANGTANIPTPVVSGDLVFCSSGYGTGSALLQLSPSGSGVRADEVYFLPATTLQNHHGGLLLVGNHIYCGHAHNNGFPICVEMATGKVAWGGRTRGAGTGSAAVTYFDNHIVFRYQNGVVALVEATPSEYRPKGSFTPDYVEGPSWAHPVVAGGCLYLREQDKLMCYDLR